MKDKGAKSRKFVDGELKMENWKGIKLQWEEEALGFKGLKKDLTAAGEMRT